MNTFKKSVYATHTRDKYNETENVGAQNEEMIGDLDHDFVL